MLNCCFVFNEENLFVYVFGFDCCLVYVVNMDIFVGFWLFKFIVKIVCFVLFLLYECFMFFLRVMIF